MWTATIARPTRAVRELLRVRQARTVRAPRTVVGGTVSSVVIVSSLGCGAWG